MQTRTRGPCPASQGVSLKMIYLVHGALPGMQSGMRFLYNI